MMRSILGRTALLCTFTFALAAPATAQSDFIRGDCNVDGNIDIGDPIFILGALFTPGAVQPTCPDSCDLNDDGANDIADPVFGLAYLFSNGADPFSPFPNCGPDPTADAIGCPSFPLCVGVSEDCTNGVDDDGDGFIDCLDSDCATDPACPETDCTNGVDDDGDGFIDCLDFDCATDPACPETDCTNGVDDDGDGFTDCQDFDCATDPACSETDCANGVDDDGDGFTDCQDLDCTGDPACSGDLTLHLDIQPILGDTIGAVGACTLCHSGPLPPQGLSLAPEFSYGNTVGAPSTECAPVNIVQPGDSTMSWLYRKITGTHTDPDMVSLGCTGVAVGSQMPPFPFCCLAQGEIDLIEQWITGGAKVSTLVINEVDYDQVGTDNDEFLEIYNSGTSAYPLAGLAVVLMNGNNSVEYNVIDLSTAGPSIPAGGYLVVHSSTVIIAPGALSVQFAAASNNIQNGAPDGIVLVDLVSPMVLDALSYEGSIVGGVITGFAEVVNLVEGTPATAVDDNVTPGLVLVRSPNGTDTDDADSDWTTSTTPTPGSANQ